MVPRQKYDVIHYLREAYLKPHNLTQYTKADDVYLAKLPAGKKNRGSAAPRTRRRLRDLPCIGGVDYLMDFAPKSRKDFVEDTTSAS